MVEMPVLHSSFDFLMFHFLIFSLRGSEICVRTLGVKFTAIYEKTPEDSKAFASVNAGNGKKLKVSWTRKSAKGGVG